MILFNHYALFYLEWIWMYGYIKYLKGYNKYYDNGSKNMTFVTDNEKVYDKYNEIWEVIRNF